MSEYSEEIAEAVKEFLINSDWNYDFDSEDGIFQFVLTIDSRLKKLRYHILIHETSYTSYAVSPLNADNDDKAVMKELADFICRANYGLRNGNFELDMRDGELRYKVFVDCNNRLPSQEIIRGSIILPSIMFEKYTPGLLDVMFKGSTGEEAVAKCEE